MPVIDVNLKVVSPLDPDCPFPKQWEFLSLDRSGPHKTYNHYVGGRGSSKSTSGIVLAWDAVTRLHPGKAGIWTEPTLKLCRDVFLREWKRIVPGHLYKLNKSEMTITMIPELGGGTIDVRSRNVDDPTKEVAKGPNYAWGIDDEAAYKFREDVFWDIDAAIRDGKAGLFHDTLSTPKLNDYKELVFSEGHRLVKATSMDNPHLPPEWAERMRDRLGPKRFRQEILGEWIALEGLIWDSWSNDPWPAGNIVDIRHNQARPFYLFFDLGVVTSAWVIVQAIEPGEQGRHKLPFGERLWVATAEYLPVRDGTARRMLAKIKQDFGTPTLICCGHDVNTRTVSGLEAPQYVVSQVFGGVPVIPIGADPFTGNKIVQQDRLDYLIESPRGHRRFAVSKHLRSHDPKKRGLLAMMKEDSWDTTNRNNPFMPKEGRLEHVRDAVLYGAVGIMNPPSYDMKDDYARM